MSFKEQYVLNFLILIIGVGVMLAAVEILESFYIVGLVGPSVAIGFLFGAPLLVTVLGQRRRKNER